MVSQKGTKLILKEKSSRKCIQIHMQIFVDSFSVTD